MAKKARASAGQSRRAQRRVARLFAALISLGITAMLGFGLALGIEATDGFGLAGTPAPYTPPAIQLPQAQATTPDPAATPAPTGAPGNIHVDNSAWNFLGEVERTINEVPPVSPSARMLSLPENSRAPDDFFNGVTFLGDSISQGFTVYRKATGAKVCAYKGISLKAVYDGSLVDRGDGTKESPLAAVAASAPQHVYVMMGPNSYVAYRQDESFLAYYDEMVRQLVETLGTEVNIYLQSITPVLEGTPRFDMDRIRRLNDQIAVLAHNHGVYYLDLHEIFANEKGYLKEEYGAGDGYHLRPAAYDVWVDYILTHTLKSKENPTI